MLQKKHKCNISEKNDTKMVVFEDFGKKSTSMVDYSIKTS